MPPAVAHSRTRSPHAYLLAGVTLATAFLGTLALARSASAHGRSLSYSSWVIDARGANVTLRMPLLELSRLGPTALPPELFDDEGPGGRLPAADPVADFFTSELVLSAADEPCPAIRPARRLPDSAGWVRYAWRIDCPTGDRALAIRSRVLLEVAPSHLHFARARFSSSPELVREQVLTEASPVFVLRSVAVGDTGRAGGSGFADYVALGVRHILSGWDHLAFLLGLVLVSDRLGTIARLVTGFTLAHSLTLGLTVLGLVHPRAAAVETVIAFSVALVAVEKGWLVAGRTRAIPLVTLAGLALIAVAACLLDLSIPFVSLLGLMLFTGCYFGIAGRAAHDRLRIALTFAFGLVHGFGFAGVLAELSLPTGRLVPALAGFNLGVELGQIAIVLIAWPALALLGRAAAPAWQRAARDLVTAGLCGLGCFWLIQRAFAF